MSYTVKTKRLAVGARSGQVGVYDLKQRKTNMVNAHNHPVTVLCFSEDGKLLATYSYGDSTLSIWHVRDDIKLKYGVEEVWEERVERVRKMKGKRAGNDCKNMGVVIEESVQVNC